MQTTLNAPCLTVPRQGSLSLKLVLLQKPGQSGPPGATVQAPAAAPVGCPATPWPRQVMAHDSWPTHCFAMNAVRSARLLQLLLLWSCPVSQSPDGVPQEKKLISLMLLPRHSTFTPGCFPRSPYFRTESQKMKLGCIYFHRP